MKRRKPFLSYKGVNVYHSFKGREALMYWYAMVPNHRAESGKEGGEFDVRKLPAKYTAGLLIENKHKGTLVGNEFRFDFEAYQAEREAHMEAIRRAIDDGFALGETKRPGKPFRPLFQAIGVIGGSISRLLRRKA